MRVVRVREREREREREAGSVWFAIHLFTIVNLFGNTSTPKRASFI